VTIFHEYNATTPVLSEKKNVGATLQTVRRAVGIVRG
jgi:hypothetical protein